VLLNATIFVFIDEAILAMGGEVVALGNR